MSKHNDRAEKAKASRMMTDLVRQGDFVDCGEAQYTQLAEYVAESLGHHSWLDDSTHWIWEIATLIDVPA